MLRVISSVVWLSFVIKKFPVKFKSQIKFLLFFIILISHFDLTFIRTLATPNQSWRLFDSIDFWLQSNQQLSDILRKDFFNAELINSYKTEDENNNVFSFSFE